ncbi:hypothetical protein DIPPA_05998 [Diplonema papillatum]|nr:hypothetical protein DIPPA_05998 [Diplonema papillatum]
MLKRSSSLAVAPRQLGPHGRSGSYQSPLLRRPNDVEPKEDVGFSVENMSPGVSYEGTRPGYMGPVSVDSVQTRSPMAHLWHETVPSKLLDLSLVFSKVEKGDIVPRPYLSVIVEPESADEEKHPIPVLPWWHHRLFEKSTVSYALRAEEVETEGADGDPWFHLRNPGRLSITKLQQHRTDKKERSNKWMMKSAWWRRGRRVLNRSWFHTKTSRFLGNNPWWLMANSADTLVSGRSNVTSQQTPQWAYYKFLPILGFNGYGTAKGEISVESRYIEVGLDEIQWWVDTGLLPTNETITPNTLVECRLAQDYHWPGLKLVTNNCTWFSATIDLELENADPEAIALVEKNGGSFTARWRDDEAVAKEKAPWRFPVIATSQLPPEELIRDVYAAPEKRGYLTEEHYRTKLRANPASPREWSLISRTPDDIGELPPHKEPIQAQPILRSPFQVSLQKKQDYWEDFLNNTAGTADSRLGKLTPDPFYLWEHTYFHKSGPGHPTKHEPPEGEEIVVFPGYPYRDSRFYNFIRDQTTSEPENKRKTGSAGTFENPYEVTQMDRVRVEKPMAWEIKGEGWRTEEDAEIRYRNPYNNPYLKERITAWQALEKRRREFAKVGKTIGDGKSKKSGSPDAGDL